VVLAHALAQRAKQRALALSIAHVNHALRGAGSDGDEAFVAGLADSLGLRFESLRVDPRARIAAAPSSRARPTLQEAARRLRADALRELAGKLGAAHVATAHTADDQAETVLLRLLRGSGPAGLGGIAERSADGAVVRPLLGISRASVLEQARRDGIAWREDPSNRDGHYARARLRHEWLPGLARAFNPSLLRAIGDLAEAQRRESEWISSWVEAEASRRFTAAADGSLRVSAEDWSETPDALARRLARTALVRVGAARDVSRAHLDRIVRFWRAGRRGRSIELPDGLVLSRDARGFRLARGLPPRRGC
jgi:tRNA(Ile)-lysidine synthase